MEDDGGNLLYNVILDQSAFVVRNELIKYELPATGGSGSIKYIVCGFSLLVVALVMFIKKRLNV